MAFAFDTLAFAKRLRGGGIPDTQADVHAEAAREFIMAELATKSDLEVVRRELDTSIQTVRKDLEASIQSVRKDLEASIQSVKQELEASIHSLRKDMEASIHSLRKDMEASIHSLRKDMEANIASVREEIRTLRMEMIARIEHAEARMTIRLGSMIVVATGILAALIKL